MATKKTGARPVPVTTTEEKLKAVRLYLPADQHKKLRRLAADCETNMALMARRIVLEYLAAHTPKGAAK